MSAMIVQAGYAVATLFIVTAYALIMSGIVTVIVARVHGRIGPPIWQPYINIFKTLSMRTAISHGIMFYLGPVFRLTGGIGLLFFMPVIFGSPWMQNYSFAGDVILVVYFVFFGMLGMALGAAESGHPYSAIGIMRGLAQNTAAEFPFALALMAVVAQHHTLSITDIVAAQQGGLMNWTMMTNPVATLAGMLAFLGMMMHSPFDVHLAPQEIPIGPPTEFHSTYLGLMQANRAIFHAAKLILFMNLFFGGATSIPEMMVKVFCLYMISVFAGVVFPRYRVEQSIRWLLRVPLVVGVIAVILNSF